MEVVASILVAVKVWAEMQVQVRLIQLVKDKYHHWSHPTGLFLGCCSYTEIEGDKFSRVRGKGQVKIVTNIFLGL